MEAEKMTEAKVPTENRPEDGQLEIAIPRKAISLP